MINPLSSRSDTFLANLSNVEQRLQLDQRQASSGLALQTVSDNPDNVSSLLAVDARIAHNNQLKYNLGRVKTEVDAAESAINNATVLLDRAREIGAQGSNGTTTSVTRQELAAQIGDIITQIQGLTTTQVEGRFIFSGNKDSVPPYGNVDFTQANSVGPYQGSASSRVIEHPNGSTFVIGYSASQIFDQGTSSTSVFQALSGLRTALLANNQTAVTASTGDIATASSYLSQQQALYGDIQNQVADATQYQEKLNTSLLAQRSNLQDADLPAVITDLQLNQTAEQAALQVQASLPRKSLFDYLG